MKSSLFTWGVSELDEEITILESNDIEERARKLLFEAENKAWKSLSQGKYSQFGYWSAKVVQFRELLNLSREPSPFAELVKFAKGKQKQKCVHCGHLLTADGKSHAKEGFSWPEVGEPQTEDGDLGCAAGGYEDEDGKYFVCGCQTPKHKGDGE